MRHNVPDTEIICRQVRKDRVSSRTPGCCEPAEWSTNSTEQSRS